MPRAKRARPGPFPQPAPRLISRKALSLLKPGSVVVDLAAEAGGNCEGTVPGERVTTDNGVTILGVDLLSRAPGLASTLFSSNVSKFLLSMGPFTGAPGVLAFDDKDPAVRGALVLRRGAPTWPPPPGLVPAPAPPAPTKEPPPKPARDPAAAARSGAAATTAAVGAALAAGALAPTAPAFAAATTFGLASVCGYQTVWGVAPALHSPLMSVTNAISGGRRGGVDGEAERGSARTREQKTPTPTPSSCRPVRRRRHALRRRRLRADDRGARDGRGRFGRERCQHWRGFHVTRSMLALFRRPGDPPDHVGYYAVPTGVLIAGTWAGQAAGLPGVTPAAYLASSVLCIAAIACLARQDTARLGNALGVAGVAGGVAVAAGALEVDVATAVQLAGLLAAGGGTGLAIARRMATTDLPQTVAGFHALVGGAAVLTSAAAALAGGPPDALHTAATVAGTVIGAITLTGSAVAYGKLAGHLPSAPLALPGKNAINLGLAGLTGLAGASAFSAGDAAGVATSLAAATASASLLGAHTTASIGGADMPVVVTLLNSYSGYALCAEGFLLGNDLLTSVGALIGASGGILSYIMCAAMNRSLANVVFGGYAVKAKAVKPAATGDERHGGRAGAVGLVAASARRPPTPPPPPQPPPPTSPPWPTCWFMPRTSSSCRGTAWRSPARRATSRRWPPRCGRPARACASPSTPSPAACRASSTCCWPSRGCRTTGCLKWMKSMKTSPPRTWSSSLAPTTR